MSRRARAASLAAVALWAALPWLLAGRVSLSILVFMALHALMAIGLTVLAGQAGQISLGQAGFYGIGAYVSGILTARLGVEPWLALLAAVVAAAAVAYAVGLPVLQLRGHYLVLATLGLNIIFEVLFRHVGITGGANGLSGIPPLRLLSLALTGDLFYFYFTWGLVALAAWMSLRLVHSRVGRALLAIRCSEAMAESVGVDPALYKGQVFAYSAALAGLAGSLYGHYLRFISPSAFTFGFSIELLVMVVVGGIGSVPGAVLGSVLLTAVREALRSVMPRIMGLGSAEYEVVAFGLLLAAAIVFVPEGIWPRLVRRLRPEPGPGQALAIGGDGRYAPGQALGQWGEASGEMSASDGLAADAGRRPQGDGRALLRVEGLTHRFGGLTALSDVSLEVHPGEVYAIIGPNGAGKTTLFNLVGGLLRPMQGRIEWHPGDDKPPVRLNGRRACAIARLGVGRTFQTPRLVLEATALENVAVGLHRVLQAGFVRCLLGLNRAEERRARSEALQLLRLVGMQAWAEYPAGALPFGGQRLVELARALALRPRLLMVDEPASGLSEAERRHLARLLRQLGVAVLIVEHDVRLVSELADRVLVLHYGRAVAEGTPEQVRRDPVVQEAYLGGEVGDGGPAV